MIHSVYATPFLSKYYPERTANLVTVLKDAPEEDVFVFILVTRQLDEWNVFVETHGLKDLIQVVTPQITNNSHPTQGRRLTLVIVSKTVIKESDYVKDIYITGKA